MPLRNHVLDIPVPLRLLLSVIPCYVLYRILRLLPTTAARSHHFMHGRLLEVLIIGAAIAGFSLYQIWRSVSLSDFKLKRDSEVASLFDRKEP
jgi:hypothetical protein